jgi:phage repressor protein C with HTH and peptisase S24 domain|nr:MAG TPA: hypothetical protein [Caudoviricetes sp.]DAS18682.1 MAG TPA: hypothetical protein [Caudoviricetes sp.]
MNEKEKIKQYLEYKGISKNKFYNQTGLSIGFLDSGKSLGVDKAKIIINNFPDLSLEWLVMDKGNMLITEDSQLAEVNVAEQFPLRTDRKLDLQSVPLYELDATAGLVALFADATRPTPISHLQIPDLPPCDGAIYVRGDSMYPLLKSGDIVLYKEINNANGCLLWGEMYLLSFTLDGEDYITIKYVQKSEVEGFVRLVSHNPHHAPQEIPRDSIRAVALVKASVRFNTMG